MVVIFIRLVRKRWRRKREESWFPVPQKGSTETTCHKMTRRCRIIVAPTRCAEMPQPPIGGPACGRGRERAACSKDMEVQARGKARPGQKGPAPCAWPALHPGTCSGSTACAQQCSSRAGCGWRCTWLKAEKRGARPCLSGNSSV